MSSGLVILVFPRVREAIIDSIHDVVYWGDGERDRAMSFVGGFILYSDKICMSLGTIVS